MHLAVTLAPPSLSLSLSLIPNKDVASFSPPPPHKQTHTLTTTARARAATDSFHPQSCLPSPLVQAPKKGSTAYVSNALSVAIEAGHNDIVELLKVRGIAVCVCVCVCVDHLVR